MSRESASSTMRGTAWPNGAYRQHNLYEDGIARPTVETISGVLHVRETIFGHKWVYKLNETRREAKQHFKRHFEFNYFVAFIAVIAIFIIVGAAVLFTVFGSNYFYLNQKNISSQLHQPTILNRTKIVFKIHTKSHLTNNNNKENTQIFEQTTENSIQQQEDDTHTPGCNCQKNEICLQNTSTAYPECTRMKDTTDPTGCGGLCQLEVQSCKRLDNHLNIFSCIDIHTLICTKEQWKCESTLMCIETEQKCDGVIHCYDRSDEFNCECELNHSFRCTDNISCFSNTKKCDGSVDCWDASDEKNCTRECGPLNVPCYNGQCIANDKFCDGIYDCKDKSDEPRGCYNPNVTIGRAYR